jgi:type IV secretory pathway VirD2 relaxase
VIARDYLSHGMRSRVAEIATERLGPRTESEIRKGLIRDPERLALDVIV